MLWDWFSANGPISLVKVHGVVDFNKYHDILNQNPVTNTELLLERLPGLWSKALIQLNTNMVNW